MFWNRLHTHRPRRHDVVAIICLNELHNNHAQRSSIYLRESKIESNKKDRKYKTKSISFRFNSKQLLSAARNDWLQSVSVIVGTNAVDEVNAIVRVCVPLALNDLHKCECSTQKMDMKKKRRYIKHSVIHFVKYDHELMSECLSYHVNKVTLNKRRYSACCGLNFYYYYDSLEWVSAADVQHSRTIGSFIRTNGGATDTDNDYQWM